MTESLTPTEKLILELIWEHDGNVKKVCSHLSIANQTYRSHLCNIRKKIGLEGASLVSVMKYAIRQGWIETGG